MPINRDNKKYILTLALGTLIGIVMEYFFPVLGKNILLTLKDVLHEVIITICVNDLIILIDINYQKHRKKRKRWKWTNLKVSPNIPINIIRFQQVMRLLR